MESSVEDTKTDTLDSFYHNFYSFHTNEMSIISKHSLPYSLYILYVFFPFRVSIYHFLSIFQNAPKVVQKRIRVWKRTAWKNHTKYSNWYLFAVFTNIHVSFSIPRYSAWYEHEHSTWAHKRHSVNFICFLSDPFFRIRPKKCTECFCFWG